MCHYRLPAVKITCEEVFRIICATITFQPSELHVKKPSRSCMPPPCLFKHFEHGTVLLWKVPYSIFWLTKIISCMGPSSFGRFRTRNDVGQPKNIPSMEPSSFGRFHTRNVFWASKTHFEYGPFQRRTVPYSKCVLANQKTFRVRNLPKGRFHTRIAFG